MCFKHRLINTLIRNDDLACFQAAASARKHVREQQNGFSVVAKCKKFVGFIIK